jgi:uncharacterized protein (TIGR02231 family)
MKTCIVLLFSFISLQSLIWAAEPVEVTSRIQEVTVFLRGAQISREARITLPKGTSTLTFRELPLNIDPQSIQARGEGDFVILSLVHQVNYLAPQRLTSQVKQLQDSLKIYEDQLTTVVGMISVLESEVELLHANREIGGNDKGVVLIELRQVADFYRSRLSEIKKEELKLNRQGSDLREKIEKLQNQLNSLDQDLKQPTSEVLINITSNEIVNGTLLLTYAVFEAGWVPSYDVRAKDILSPVQLFYNARVYQHTGESWDKVSLRLSTANPQQRGEKPDLQPWYLDFEQPAVPLSQYNSIRPSVLIRGTASKSIAAEMDIAETEEAITVASFTDVTDHQTNLEFSIKIPYDIPSDNKQYTINIQDYTLPAFYEYYCAPKIDREAFLVARITGWENYNLLSGDMNLFFEGTYVGKSHLSVRNTTDTLDLSLGRDKGIVVTRIKMKDFTEEKTIGSNKRETRAWEITIRNNKKQAVDLRLQDQLPISMNKDIEVEPLDYSAGKFNKETGLITWKQRIEPSSEKKLRISFAIKYPKDQHLFID